MKTLLERLGYKAGTSALVWRAPPELSDQLRELAFNDAITPTFRIAFIRSRLEMADAARQVASAYRAGHHLWLCYPKKSGKLPTDLTRDIGWEPIHELDLLGVAQVSLDETWSALRFRLRGEIGSLTRKSPTGRLVT